MMDSLSQKGPGGVVPPEEKTRFVTLAPLGPRLMRHAVLNADPLGRPRIFRHIFFTSLSPYRHLNCQIASPVARDLASASVR